MELREPSVYNSILEAISNGCNKVSEISDRIHEEKYDDLVTASNIFTNVKEKYLFFFSKLGFTNPVIERAKNEGSTLLTLKDLYEI